MAEIAVLVPTLGRSHHLDPLVRNVQEVATVPTRVYLIVEDDDTASVLAAKPLDAELVRGHFGSCAKAMNAGYAVSTEPFVHTGNDDLVYHAGWDTKALEKMDDEHHIVGTNDGNGRMSCFALVRRVYVEQESGVYDQPNAIFHEYASQYPDTELAEYAKHRRVWAEAPESVTEHMHWEFGKADANHPNYRKAQATCAADHQTFAERRREWVASA